MQILRVQRTPRSGQFLGGDNKVGFNSGDLGWLSEGSVQADSLVQHVGSDLK